jgi:hypothetical protein
MPVPLDEWTAWAERLQTASLFSNEDFRTAANAMSEETFGELAAFYLKAERENHLEAINRWLGESGGSIPMGREENGIRNLFELFAHVAGAWGRRPFTSQSLNASKLLPALPDWSKLPEEIRFLSEPAEQYSGFHYVFSDEGRDRVRAAVTPQDMEKLSLVAEQVRRVGYAKIKAWWKPLSMHAHIEAAMVFKLMGVLDALALPYYDAVQA